MQMTLDLGNGKTDELAILRTAVNVLRENMQVMSSALDSIEEDVLLAGELRSAELVDKPAVEEPEELTSDEPEVELQPAEDSKVLESETADKPEVKEDQEFSPGVRAQITGIVTCHDKGETQDKMVLELDNGQTCYMFVVDQKTREAIKEKKKMTLEAVYNGAGNTHLFFNNPKVV